LRSASVNGACHWLADDPLKRDDASRVIYTIYSEEWSVRGYGNSRLLRCLIECFRWSLPGPGQGEEHYSVWVKKEHSASESWTKLFNIEHLKGVRRLIAFRKNDK